MAKKKKEKRKYRRVADVNVPRLIADIEDDKIEPYISGLQRALGLSWNSISKLVNENPDLRAAMILRREEYIETAEQQIPDLLENASEKVRADIVKWVLKTRTDRFSDKQEQDNEVVIKIKGFDGI